MAKKIEIKVTLDYPGRSSLFYGKLEPSDNYDAIFDENGQMRDEFTDSDKENDIEIVDSLCNTFAADIENDFGITGYDVTWEVIEKQE